MNIIFENDLERWVQDNDIFCNAIIFGKGPSFRVLDRDDDEYKHTLFVCINETVNHIKKCDLLVCNDLESFDKINMSVLSYCKNILIPYHPHKSLYKFLYVFI